jgi:acetyl esterase/lipase
MPPVYASTGTRDILRPGVLAMCDRLTTPHKLIDEPDMWHVFEAYDECPQARQSLLAAAAFLQTHTRRLR